MAQTVLDRVEMAAALDGQSRSRFVAQAAERVARERLREVREGSRHQKGDEGE